MHDVTSFHQSPILNSPYDAPARHWVLDESRQPTDTIGEGRRPVSFISPIPRARKAGRGTQRRITYDADSEALDTGNQQYELIALIDGLRREIAQWRELPEAQWRVTPETARLLKHWRHHPFSDIRPFFCQIEAVETAIWLTEVAPAIGNRGSRYLDELQTASENANPGLSRMALKLATGAGKTAVMAMLIAWQTVNAVRRPSSPRFTRGFLVATPGITIRDRLRVLQPNDPDSYYASRELVPADMLREIDKAKIVITNYHAFQLRETMDLAKGSRALLQGRDGELATRETEGQMLARVMPELMSMKGVLVLNDEAHHCYRENPEEDDEGRLTGDDRREAVRNKEAARVWISRARGCPTEAWLEAGDRPLRDAVLPARFRLCRRHPLPVDRERLLPDGRHRVRHRQAAARAGGGQRSRCRDADVPQPVGPHRQEDAQEGPGQRRNTRPLGWVAARAGKPLLRRSTATTRRPSSCGTRRTSMSRPASSSCATTPRPRKLVYDYIAGFHRESGNGTQTFHNGRLELFRNFDAAGEPLPRPRTLLIDSQQLESGDALDKSFREAAADEIDRFRREIVERTGNREQAEKLTDQDLLREVMNTVGKEGRLGGGIRCVVSVAMLTEGWDANTVTHVLGLRAFGTQLLCEQVIGRSLRRQSYDLNEEGLFNAEYADVFGIPFDFTAKPVVAPPQKPAETVQVKALSPERDDVEIHFPRVAGYRVELPEDRLNAEFTEDHKLVLTP